MPQKLLSSQFSSSSVQQHRGTIRSHLYRLLPLSKTTCFLQRTHFDDMKHTEAEQSTISNGSTTPQIKQPEQVSTLITATRPHKQPFNSDTANIMHFIDFYYIYPINAQSINNNYWFLITPTCLNT
jgi:hypothetical protein